MKPQQIQHKVEDLKLHQMQQEVESWSRKNFGDQESWKPLLGAVEELGELAHAHLKTAQGIRANEDHRGNQIDAVGDIVIYLCDYCARENIDLESAVLTAWQTVKQRDWRKETKL